MEIDIQTVKNIAELSRIKITDQEAKQFEIEFREMFAYFAKIQEIHDSKVDVKTKKENGLRNDEMKSSSKEDSDKIINNFNQKEGRIMIAPKTL